MSFCRKVFATHLRQERIEYEVIDLLQEMIPNSMFIKHYYRSDLETVFERVREKIIKLNETIMKL